MSALVIKAICRRIEARYGSNRNASMAAGVSPSVWSNYCSDEQPDTTIPMHRLLLVANAEERAAVIALLDGAATGAPDDLMSEACQVVERGATLLGEVREALADDGQITPREARRIRERALAVMAELQEILAAVADGAPAKGRLRVA